MKNGVGLPLSLVWASAASAQQAAHEFCFQREREAAIGAGAAVEFAAKAVVAHCYGPSKLFTGTPELNDAELWIARDHAIRPGEPPTQEAAAAARSSLLRRHTIDARAAVRRALRAIAADERRPIRHAANKVLDARNAAIHLGDVDMPIGELGDAFVVAVEFLWNLVPTTAAGQWGTFRRVAMVGLLGRRATWQEDKQVRLALAEERFHSLGTVFVHRRNMVDARHQATCVICNSPAFYDAESRQSAPAFNPAPTNGTIAFLDCGVCGLSLWGPQIGPPEYRHA